MKFQDLQILTDVNAPLNEDLKHTALNLALAGIINFSTINNADANSKRELNMKKVEYVQKVNEMLSRNALILAIAKTESNLNPFAIGDKNLKNKAYGILQIRQPVIDDVNRVFKTSYTTADVYPKDSSTVAVISAVQNSIVIFTKYASIYSKGGTEEEVARKWNAGPAGVKKNLSIAYWNKVKGYLKS